MKYLVEVELGERWWIVTIPEINRGTQARNLDEVKIMAADLITIMTGDEQPELDVKMILPESVQEALDTSSRAHNEEALQHQLAASELRRAAQTLRDRHLSLKDVGTALGVSHQRAEQLTKKTI